MACPAGFNGAASLIEAEAATAWAEARLASTGFNGAASLIEAEAR